MDSLTHIALGACMGEAFAGKTVGKKAMLWGALAQSIPDIDFVAAFWQDTAADLLTHRGFTHSLLFCLLATFLFALLAEKWHRPHNISFLRWLYFFGAAIFIHIFLDAFNNYGVGWFEPFSHYRISFNTIYVADPFFSIIPGIVLFVLIFKKSFSKKRVFWWKLGMGVSFLYLGYCVINKLIINNDVKKILAQQHIPYNNYFTTPAPLQNWLWFVVAGNDSGFHVGYRSLFDKKMEIHFEYFPKNDFLIDTIKSRKDVLDLIQFSQGYYTIGKRQDTLLFNDLRFGQVLGWEYPRESFAFYYFLEPADIDNKLIVQRGRFARWNWQELPKFWRRIIGK